MEVSVVIPSCHPGCYLRECLDSLGGQSLAAYDFEVIIVLNGCDAACRDDVGSYVSGWGNMRVMHTDTPGVSNARNVGIRAARGEYVCFVDDDDYVSPSYLEEMLAIARRGATPLASLRCFDEEQPGIFYDDYLARDFGSIAGKGMVGINRVGSLMDVAVCKLLPAEVCRREEFDVGFSRGEDSLFMFAVSRFLTGFEAAPRSAVYYRRVRSSSASHSETLRGMVRRQVPFMCRLIAIWCRHPFQYNFRFFLTRCAAMPVNILKKLKR